MNKSTLLPRAAIRAQFASAMSDMYRQEVPKYGTLLEMVKTINQHELANNHELKQQLTNSHNLQRLSDERHGAIRLGKAQELFTMRRLFAVMGMYPVSYYDLSEAGIPVHSTAFRPLELEELNENPFRIFTSLLRLDLIQDGALREQAQRLLDKRNIFTDRLIELITRCENQAGLDKHQSEEFITEALQTFRWHQQATVDLETYQQFLNTHRLIADIVCFKGPHINHLTPRTLNIDSVQQQMKEYSLDAKAIIEGPPQRQHPILLRQTSFKALDEPIEFKSAHSDLKKGSHTARFGEIEQRGMALTPKGRRLYDQLLNEVRYKSSKDVNQTIQYEQLLKQVFGEFPDNLEQIRMQGLGYFTYQSNMQEISADRDLEQLIEQGILKYYPITYEDFLPVSAAGIFQSNLDERETQEFNRSPNQQEFEKSLGCKIINEFDYYARIQADSLKEALLKLNMSKPQIETLLHQLPLGV